MDRTETLENWMKKIAEAGLSGDQQRLELVVLSAIRSLKRHAPEASKGLGSVLTQYTTNAGSLRWKASGPPPADADEGLSLVRLEAAVDAPKPILPEPIEQKIDQFLRERRDAEKLLAEGFHPPSSVLLIGAPGTGKTMLARWAAHELGLPLMSLDLAASISSYLGKTGFNLRRVLDYARGTPCVMLLDEFDAVAKRRDDGSDLGELKRVVNVLLKELEDWPLRSVLVAATNHPDLLDPAVRRRFSLVLELPLPGPAERIAIMSRAAGRFKEHLPGNLLSALGQTLEAVSGSDVEGLTQAAVRVHLSSGADLPRALVLEIRDRFLERLGGKSTGALVRALRESSEGDLSVRELARLFDKSTSTIQHHLKKETADG